MNLPVGALCAFLSVVCVQADGASAAHPRIEKNLWVGSSSTHFNYMGKTVGDWLGARSDGKVRYVTHLVWRNATRIETFLERHPAGKPVEGLDKGQTVLERIRDGKYKFVTLQIVTHFMSDPTWGPPQDQAIDVYVKAIRAAGSEPVFYEQGWQNSKTKTQADHTNGQRMLFDAAVRTRTRLVAPCASAWDLVRKEQPDLPLQEPSDLAHPGPLGNFLNCCVFYATLTGKEPKDMPRTLWAWDHHWKQGYKADWIPPQVKIVPKGQHDPSWKGYIGPFPNGGRGYVGTIDDKTASYLEDAAWRTCQTYRKRLDAALAAQPTR